MESDNKIITRIEGHGSIKINFENLTAKLEIEEGERLFEGLLIGRPYYDAPYITSRICGVCPTSYVLASIKAIENAFGIEPSETTFLLRKLILSAQICQSHTLHLYFMVAADYLKISSSLDMPEKYPEIFSRGLKLKQLFDNAIKLVGGRAVHPLTPIVGGFSKTPTKNQLFSLRDMYENSLEDIKETVKFFTRLNYPAANREVEFMALKNDETYSYYDGIVWSSKGVGFLPSNYPNEIGEFLKPNSSAKFSARISEGKLDNGFVTGARARISMFADFLNSQAKLLLENYEGRIGPGNPFYNNIAQAFEILHFTEETIKIIDRLTVLLDGHKNSNIAIKSGIGTGAVEAPRGILYHQYEFNQAGIITRADIVTPTSQNLTSIEDDVEELLKHTQNISREKREKIIEMMIRAFDPCITCSVH